MNTYWRSTHENQTEWKKKKNYVWHRRHRHCCRTKRKLSHNQSTVLDAYYCAPYCSSSGRIFAAAKQRKQSYSWNHKSESVNRLLNKDVLIMCTHCQRLRFSSHFVRLVHNINIGGCRFYVSKNTKCVCTPRSRNSFSVNVVCRIYFIARTSIDRNVIVFRIYLWVAVVEHELGAIAMVCTHKLYRENGESHIVASFWWDIDTYIR